jgi:hypothetical protein
MYEIKMHEFTSSDPTLHSDSDSLFITGCWKTTWTWIEETGGSLTEDRAKEKGRNANQVVMWIHANPGPWSL